MKRRYGQLVLSFALLGACTNVLGLTDYTDAIESLCQCSTLPDCKSRLSASIEAANDSEVQAWLTSYKDLGCATASCDTDAYRCFYTAPDLCEEQEAPCERSEACCGYDFDDPFAGNACCAGNGDDGVCCEACSTCAEMLAAFADPMPEEGPLCMSHREAWNGMLACLMSSCSDKCDGTGNCVMCAQESCGAELAACNSNKKP